jgi:hypothetical protein
MVLVGTNHELTLAASKQENAAVENANKRSQKYLRSMLFDNRILKRWFDVLSLVQSIMMAEPKEIINISLAQLLFGNSIRTEFGIRDIFCVVLGTLFSTLENMNFWYKYQFFSCYYQAFAFKLELIEIDFLQENESITISIVLLNSHDNYRLNWNDLDVS